MTVTSILILIFFVKKIRNVQLKCNKTDTKFVKNKKCEKKSEVKPSWLNRDPTKSNEEKKSFWFGSLIRKDTTTENKNNTNQSQNMKSWFSFSKSIKDDEEESLNKSSKTEVDFMRKMCGEFREVIKGQNKEEREERQIELAKVRGAR